MTPEEFVTKLESLKPAIVELQEQFGMSKEEAIEFQQSYIAVERHNQLEIKNTIDFYTNLVRQYDISNLEIGPIHFPEQPKQFDKEKVIIAYEESNPIVINKNTKEVLMLDMINPSIIMNCCAQNAEVFFRAMLIVAEFLERLSKDDILWGNSSYARPIIAECTLIAGGKKYQNFFESIINIAD